MKQQNLPAGKKENLEKRKIAVLTGTRADYGYLKPVMKAIMENPQLELCVIATGMHLMQKYGYTYNEIENDGFKNIIKVDINQKDETCLSVAESMGTAVKKIAQTLDRTKPEFLLVLGDRSETLAGVIAAVYMNIPVAHIHGGDSAKAGLDESARHAITKFAYVHFPATSKSSERIKKLGEEDWRIHRTGTPMLDVILHEKTPDKRTLFKKYKLDHEKKLAVVVQHSVSTQPEMAGEQMRETLYAINEICEKDGYQAVIIYPNSDAGGDKIINEIKKYEKLPNIQAHRSLKQEDYLGLLKYAAVLIGNSSSGIIESSSFKLPVVNIGIRQDDRERSTNVIDVKHNKADIVKAIKKAESPEFKTRLAKCINPYGDGRASKRITAILATIRLDKELIQKKITY
ncbi:UDP-N-acetylglucosamine 2-epimerase (hydrolyzing) [Candidatus Woesearchaeota archaeon]|nr:UDP-N-acetylglucosamine 2-epimerase (hydrolyzing) [Candidatus Woesearchaeota archaeon]